MHDKVSQATKVFTFASKELILCRLLKCRGSQMSGTVIDVVRKELSLEI